MTDSTLSAENRDDMRDLMAAVGQALLCWGYAEAAIRDRVSAFSVPQTSGRGPALVRWREMGRTSAEAIQLVIEIEPLASIRNYLAHGLASASVYPDAEPRVVCRLPEGKQTFNLSTLREVADQLHMISHRIRDLS